MLKNGFCLLISLWAVVSFAQQYGWEPQSSGTANTLEAVAFVDANHGWAVGGNKGLLWQSQPSGVTDYLYSISAVDENTAWSVGGSGRILKTTDGGAHWTIQNSGTTSSLEVVFFIDNQTGWVAGSGGAIRKTTDGGTTWNAQNSGTYQWLNAIFFIDANTGWAAGMSGTIIKTTNGGTNWTPQTSGTTTTLHAISFLDANTGWIVGGDGTVLKTTNGGATWMPQSSGTTVELESVSFVDANNGWAAGDRATIIKTTDGGNSWMVKSELVWPPYELHGIAFVDANTGYAVGTFGTILSTNDGGNTWKGQNSGTTQWLYGITLVNDHVGWVVGNSGTILKMASGTIIHTANGGTAWQAQDAQTPSTLYGVDFVDASTGWAVGGQGTIMHSLNGGQSWSRQSSGTSKQLRGVSFINANFGWAVGESGIILRTTDGGTNWFPQTSGTTDTLHAVAFVDQNTGCTVGSKGIVLKTSNGGQSWEKQNLTNQSFRDIAMWDANTGWIVGNGGTIFKTINGGTTWINQSSGITEDLHAVTFVDANLGWVAGNNGIVLKTTTGGDFWVRQNSSTTENLLAISAFDAMHGWAVGEKGTIVKTSSATDNQPPSLQIEQPTPGQRITISDQPVTVSGTAGDENGVAVKIGFDYLTLVGDRYTHRLYLPNGAQVIRVLASDPAGNLSAAEVTVQVDMNLPTGEMKYYLYGSGSTQQLSLTPYSPSVTSETYIGSWSQTFPTILTGYLNGSEYKYNLRLASGGGTTVFTLSWYIEYQGRRTTLANTTFPVSSNIYSNYTGTAIGPHSVAFPGQTLGFEVVASSPGGMKWGNGASGSYIIIPGGTTLPPETPQLVSPPDGVIDQPRTLTLNWSFVSGASRYHLQVATDSLFTATVLDIATISGTSMSLGPLTPSTRHYWRVRALNEGGPSSWSSMWRFTTIVALPARVVLLSPSHNAIITADSVQCLWRRGEPAVERYWFEISTDSLMTSAMIDSSLTATDTTNTMRHLQHNRAYWWRVKAKNVAGWGPFSEKYKFSVMLTAVATEREIPAAFYLNQNYPNPFNPSTTIEYTLSKPSQVELIVYDVLGHKVQVLVNSRQEAGLHRVRFESGDLPAGLYLYRLRAGEFEEMRKMVIIR